MQNVIAFTYKQNGLIVGCKYRTMEKRFSSYLLTYECH